MALKFNLPASKPKEVPVPDVMPKEVFKHPGIEALSNFPERWGMPNEDARYGWQSHWSSLVAGLAAYIPPPVSFKLKNLDRKWELVSAYQKTVRRGNKDLALKLVSAMDSQPSESPYWWRRLCTTACEDVGYGDVVLMNFVIATSMIFTPKKYPDMNYKVMCFLTEKMCDTTRSRMFCSLAIIESRIKEAVVPHDLTAWEFEVIKKLKDDRTKKLGTLTGWAAANDYRGEGMLYFQTLPINYKITQVPGKASHVLLKGLPDYTYDMHTRVGKAAIRTLRKLPEIDTFFTTNLTHADQFKILGYALFYMEGGLLVNSVKDYQLCTLEYKMVAAGFGLSIFAFLNLMNLVATAVESGKMNTFREAELVKVSY